MGKVIGIIAGVVIVGSSLAACGGQASDGRVCGDYYRNVVVQDSRCSTTSTMYRWYNLNNNHELAIGAALTGGYFVAPRVNTPRPRTSTVTPSPRASSAKPKTTPVVPKTKPKAPAAKPKTNLTKPKSNSASKPKAPSFSKPKR